MSQKKELRTPPLPAPVEYVVATTCDICSHTVPFNVEHEESWERGYSVDLVTLTRKQGEAYPETGSITEESYDICPDCWDEHLMPFLKSLGATPQTRERSW